MHLQKMLRLLNALTVDRAKLLRSTSPVPSDRSSKAHSEVSSESPFVERLVKAFRAQVVMKQIPDSLMETEEAKVEQAVKTIRVCLQTLTESQTPASVSPVLNGRKRMDHNDSSLIGRCFRFPSTSCDM